MPVGVLTRSTCRACGAGGLAPVLTLGTQCVSTFVAGEDGMAAPLDLVLCDVAAGGCGLLQTRHTVPGDYLYSFYWYQSGINESMRAALADVAGRAARAARLAPGDVVLDIGCNDGTLLRSYAVPGLALAGFEPAKNLQEPARAGTTRIFGEFFRAEPFLEAFGEGGAKVVTAIAMFYDLDTPGEFLADVARCLHPDGLFVIQMSYLPSMLEQNAFDNICHEHVAYYALFTLRSLLNRHGLEVVDVELNAVNGGSFQAYVRHRAAAGAGPGPRVLERLRAERELGLDGRAPYQGFVERSERIRRALAAFVGREVGRGKTVYVYGASTKGNTLLQYCGLDHRLIRAAAERSPAKWGLSTVGTRIPIVSEERARSERPDYFLVLPWHFLGGFVERERAFLEAGGRFIVPLPTPRLVSREGTVPLPDEAGAAGG